MLLLLFIKGLLLGLAIAVPVGPIGVLCIQRSLHDGFKIGLLTGFGAACADGAYGAIAAFGLTTVSSLLETNQFWIRLIGGLFLLYLGVKLFLKKPNLRSAGGPDPSPIHAFTSTFFLTLSNPMTILFFIAVFAGIGLGPGNAQYLEATILVSGIILGSSIWWISLASGIAFISPQRFSLSVMGKLNRLTGCIIFIFGVVALFKI